jgi:chromosome partitioning protein
MGYRVLATDRDSNASLTKRMGVRLNDVPASVYDLLMSPPNLIRTADVIVQPEHLHFDLIPGSENLSYAEPSLLMARKQRALADRLAEVEDGYDFVLIDTAGHESFLHTLGHTYANEVILPLEADKDHWDALVTTLASVEKVRTEGLNPNIQPVCIFVNRFRSRTTFGDWMLKTLKAEYPELWVPFVAHESIAAKEAGGYGKPIVTHDPDGQPAQAYRKLAEHLLNG